MNEKSTILSNVKMKQYYQHLVLDWKYNNFTNHFNFGNQTINSLLPKRTNFQFESSSAVYRQYKFLEWKDKSYNLFRPQKIKIHNVVLADKYFHRVK